MALRIREADLTHDRAELIRFLDENLPETCDSSRFDWLYLQNPHGEARAWIAMEEAGKSVGVAAAFPRSFRVTGKPGTGWVLGDFCIAAEYRSLGPAVSLQRALLASLTKDEDAICYDFPSSGMLSIYRRLGIPLLGQHVRYVKLLKIDEKVQQFLPQGFFARGLTHVGNLGLRLKQLLQSLPRDIEFSVQQDSFDEEFTDLHRRSNGLHVIEAFRSANHLNWRYNRHHQKRFCVVVARRRSELIGYAVVEVAGREAVLSDIHTDDEQNALAGILTFVEITLRKKDVHRLSVPVLQGCHLSQHLRRAGFYERESVPVVAYASSSTKSALDIREAKNWFLLYGDRES
jgi:hypothetical protein